MFSISHSILNFLRVISISIVVAFLMVSFSGVLGAQDSPQEESVDNLVEQIGDTVSSSEPTLYNDFEVENDTKQVDTNISGEEFTRFMGFGFGFFLVVILLAVVGFVFWLWSLIHVLSNPVANKLIWVIVIVFLQLLGAILYYFIGRKKLAGGKNDNNSDEKIVDREEDDKEDSNNIVI